MAWAIFVFAMIIIIEHLDGDHMVNKRGWLGVMGSFQTFQGVERYWMLRPLHAYKCLWVFGYRRRKCLERGNWIPVASQGYQDLLHKWSSQYRWHCLITSIISIWLIALAASAPSVEMQERTLESVSIQLKLFLASLPGTKILGGGWGSGVGVDLSLVILMGF